MLHVIKKPAQIRLENITKRSEDLNNFKILNPYRGARKTFFPPKTINKKTKNLFCRSIYCDESFVFCFDNGIAEKEGGVFDESTTFIPEMSEGNHPPKRIKKIKGTVAVMTHQYQFCYFDWMFRVLPKIHLLKKVKLIPDKIYIDTRKKFQRETIRLLGYDRKKIISADACEAISAEKLIVPLQFSPECAWTCQFLRKSFLHRKRNKKKRIYISREKTIDRRIENEKEIMLLLKKYGFVKVNPEKMNIEDQTNLFFNAEAVVSAHGSGLTNIVFCEKGTKVVEIAPFCKKKSHMYWAIGNQIGLDYYYLLNKNTNVEIRNLARIMKLAFPEVII